MSSDDSTIKSRVVSETGVMVALATILYLLSPGQLPNAGRISMEMLPIYFISFRRGPKVGVFAGAVLGLIILLIDPRVVHPLQFIMDYPLPHMLVGASGVFRKNIYLGIIAGGLGRFLSHFISGMVFFDAFVPKGTPVWLYSLIYNGSYLLPQIILAMILLPIILKRVR